MKQILAILIILMAAGTAQAAWYDTNYTYFKTVTVDHSYVNGTVTNHTLLINVTDTDLRDHAQADGDDIIFVNSANTTQLDHQIDGTFNSTTGHLKTWIRVPSITNTSDTVINMYYNYSAATNSENPSGVWGTNASGIWLMDEGTGVWANDSSGNNNNGSLVNGATWADGGLQFDGVNDYVYVADDASLTLSNDWTVWLRIEILSNAGSYFQYLLSNNGYMVNPSFNWFFMEASQGTDPNKLKCTLGDDDTTTANATTAGTPGTDVDSQLLTLVKNGNTITQYINANVDGTTTDAAFGSINGGNWYMGSRSDLNAGRFFYGSIDSVRIHNRALSAAEIATSYNNTNDPTNFTIFGAEQSQAAGAGAPSITSHAPLGTIWPEVADTQLFNVSVNQSTSCYWYRNGTLVETDAANTEHSYTNTSMPGGVWNITADTGNTNGNDTKTWIFEVGADSISYVILQDTPTNQSMVAEWNTTRVGSNVTEWGRWQNHTFDGWDYTFRYANGTAIKSLTASGDNDTLWFNHTSLLPTGVYFINATTTYNTITLYANEYALINNWTSDQTYQQVDNNISNAVCMSWYNYTSSLWEAYRCGYTYGATNIIPKNCSVFVFVDGQTTVSATPNTGGVTIQNASWFYSYLTGSTAKTHTQIKTEMNTDGLDVWALYGFSNATQAYTSTGSYSVAPNEGYAVYCNVSGEYIP